MIFSYKLGQDICVEEEATESPSTEFENIEYRAIEASEASQLSRLFYSVYGYNYIHDYVYDPIQIEKMITNVNRTILKTAKSFLQISTLMDFKHIFRELWKVQIIYSYKLHTQG